MAIRTSSAFSNIKSTYESTGLRNMYNTMMSLHKRFNFDRLESYLQFKDGVFEYTIFCELESDYIFRDNQMYDSKLSEEFRCYKFRYINEQWKLKVNSRETELDFDEVDRWYGKILTEWRECGLYIVNSELEDMEIRINLESFSSAHYNYTTVSVPIKDNLMDVVIATTEFLEVKLVDFQGPVYYNKLYKLVDDKPNGVNLNTYKPTINYYLELAYINDLDRNITYRFEYDEFNYSRKKEATVYSVKGFGITICSYIMVARGCISVDVEPKLYNCSHSSFRKKIAR